MTMIYSEDNNQNYVRHLNVNKSHLHDGSFSQSRLLPHSRHSDWMEKKVRRRKRTSRKWLRWWHQSQVVKSNTISLLTSKEKCACVWSKYTQRDNMRSPWATSRIIWNNVNERFISSNRKDRDEKENTNFTTILLEFYSVVKMMMRRLRRSVHFTWREKKKWKATVYHFDMIFHIIECIEIAQQPQYRYYHLKSLM